MARQRAISFSISFLSPSNRAGGRTFYVSQKNNTMIPIRMLILVALFVSAPLGHAQAVKGFSNETLVLYQPNDVLQARVSSVDNLVAYVNEIERVCQTFFADAAIPESLDIVIAIRPDKTSKVWFISSIHPGIPKDREALRGQLEKLPPCEVTGGPIAFAMVSSIAGGDGKTIKPSVDGKPPLPKEWSEAAKKKQADVVLPDGILDDVWPPKK